MYCLGGVIKVEDVAGGKAFESKLLCTPLRQADAVAEAMAIIKYDAIGRVTNVKIAAGRSRDIAIGVGNERKPELFGTHGALVAINIGEGHNCRPVGNIITLGYLHSGDGAKLA